MFCVAPMVLGLAAAAGPAHTFGWNDTDFLLDGQRFLIRSGEMHSARIPREYWRHRLQMVRAMGCNTVCAYLFWNTHEPKEGRFDFRGQNDVAEYCRIAHQEGLKVILRPGPYSCAEWEFGGFPWWLLKTPDIKVRTQDPRYLAAAKRYLAQIGKQLAPLQWTRGGPIIMVQVENEYGSYGSDREYIGLIRDYLAEAGFDVPLFTCDGPSQLKNDVRDDIFSVVNFGGDPVGGFKALRAVRPKGPLMCGEFYPGWFDSWGSKHHTGKPEEVVGVLKTMLEMNASFSIYMAHGGTTFGYWSGANAPPFSPQSTSYDYDAPISENGAATPKYHAIRDLFAQHLLPGESLTPVPSTPPIVRIPEFSLAERAPLMENLGRGRNFDSPPTFEQIDQPHGAILYRTTLPAGAAGTLDLPRAHDYTIIMLDGKRVGVLDRRLGQNSKGLPERASAARLELLVYAFGRVNYGGQIHDRKGIVGDVGWTSNGKTSVLKGWSVFGLTFDGPHLRRLKFAARPGSGPAVYRGRFDLSRVGDTFLDTRGWNMGVVWVNGHNLGRFWNIGPQQTLYVPAPWLKVGSNEVLVLDLGESVASPTTQGLREPILDDARP